MVTQPPVPQHYKAMTPAARRQLREQYVIAQEGKCMYCQGSLEAPPPKHITDRPIKWALFPPLFLKYPVHLHHDHDTGLTLGAVHSYCNAVLWQYEGK